MFQYNWLMKSPNIINMFKFIFIGMAPHEKSASSREDLYFADFVFSLGAVLFTCCNGKYKFPFM